MSQRSGKTKLIHKPNTTVKIDETVDKPLNTQHTPKNKKELDRKLSKKISTNKVK